MIIIPHKVLHDLALGNWDHLKLVDMELKVTFFKLADVIMTHIEVIAIMRLSVYI